MAAPQPNGLSSVDFETLNKHQDSAYWGDLPAPEQAIIEKLWETLKSYAALFVDDIASEIEVQPYTSKHVLYYRVARDLWSCVFPAAGMNKSYHFQLFFIVGPTHMEFGFGLGSGDSAIKDPGKRAAAMQELLRAKNSLASLQDDSALATLVDQARASGFKLRKAWRSDPAGAEDFASFKDWASYASSESGASAAISRFEAKADIVALGSGLYEHLRNELRQFVPLLKAIYNAQVEVSVSGPMATGNEDLQSLREMTLWDEGALRDILDSLESGDPTRQQVVLAGPPGTGKTWVGKAIAAHFTGEWDKLLSKESFERIRVVQFHPSYSYEQFVEGLQPVVKNGAITFSPEPGVVRSEKEAMDQDPRRRVILIDEMNRANLPRVLGELLYLFEYREESIRLLYTPEFKLPKDLFFIGTMNTADRSIRSIDTALRRRFEVFDCPPDVQILRRFYEAAGKGRTNHLGEELYEGFVHLNEELEQRLPDHTIGHTFFMDDQFDDTVLRRVWKRKIEPLIKEYFFAAPKTVEDFPLNKFWPSLS